MDTRTIKSLVMVSVVTLTLTFGFLDVKAGGTEISFSIFYLLPISLATWYLRTSFGYLIATFALLLREGIDFSRLDLYSHPFVPIENTILRGIFFIGTVWAISRIRLLMEREKRYGTTDFLTGLPNSRALFNAMGSAQSQCRRSGTPLTLAFMDCDNFKLVNDRLGHRSGDEVLKLIGKIIQQNIRKGDVCARLGGDEFALLFPDTGQKVGRQILTRIHKSLLQAMEAREFPVTFSVGAIVYPHPPESVDDMLQQADAIMYSVKKQAKNQVKVELYPADFQLSCVASGESQ